MPSIRRRSALKTIGLLATSGFLAGCPLNDTTSTPENPPAGSLEFWNDDSVPHELSVEVLDVGSRKGERLDGHQTVAGTPEVEAPQRNLTASAVVEPEQTRTYESVFQSPVWYDVRFTIDDKYPGEEFARTLFHPVPPSDETTGRTLAGYVSSDGRLSWRSSSTDDLGSAFQ